MTQLLRIYQVKDRFMPFMNFWLKLNMSPTLIELTGKTND